MNDDLKRRLEAWGSTDVSGPDVGFADALERDLRSQAYFSRPAQPGWARRAFAPRPAMFVFSSLVLLAGVWLIARDGSTPTSEVVMSQAIDTEVVVPGADPARPSADMTLPDGTRIAIDEAGSAVVDGVILGGGTEAVVENGRIEVLETGPTATTVAQATGRPTQSPTATVAAPQITPDVDTPATPAPEATVQPAASPTPTPTATTRPTAPPSAEPTDPPGEAQPIQIELEIEALSEQRALLTWVAQPRDDIGGWEVVVLTGDRERSIALLRDPGVREVQVERPAPEGAMYIVRARAVGGAVLGQSNAVSLSGDL